MDILILGNGFDLAHELETSYSDFINFYKAKDFQDYCKEMPKYTKCLEVNLWMRHFINRQRNLNGKNWIDLEQEIFEVISTLNNLSLDKTLKGSSKFFLYSLSLYESDFIFNNIKTLLVKEGTEHYELRKSLNMEEVKKKGYDLILGKPYGDTFSVYIKNFESFINFLYDQLREFTEAFKEYLTKYVLYKLRREKYYLVLKNDGKERRTGPLHVLNFNYTNVCEKLYGESSSQRGFTIKTIHLHGSVNNIKDCNLVLGSKTYTDFTTNINPEFNIFQKHNQRHKYGTIEAYQDFYHQILSKVDVPVNFHVIGHSLDESDRRILKLIFDSKKDSIIYIYYYSEEIHQSLINNITKIITEDEVTSRVRFIKQDDYEKGIFQEISSSVVASKRLI